MSADNLWAIEWNSTNRLDGQRRHLIRDRDTLLPLLFRTRRLARERIRQSYGYLRDRPDLRAEPHGWRMPRAVRVKIFIVERKAA